MNRFIKAFRKVRQTFNEMPRGSAVGGTFRHALFVLLLLIAGVGSAWADTWDGTIKKDADNQTAPNGIKGKGTEADPYLINDANGFAYFMKIVKSKWTGYNSYWKLDADIDLNNHTWAHGSNTGNSFQGHFDGGNHIVSNVKLDVTTNSNYGLFPTIQGASATSLAEVKNLKIKGVTFISTADRKETTRLGALAGLTKFSDISDIEVSNVTFTYANITNNHYLGGVVGYADEVSSLNKLSADAVTATFNGTTTNLYFAGLVGGLNKNTSITGCSTNNVTITYNASANASRISGLVGYAKGAAGALIKISGCTVTGTKINLTKGISNASYIGVLLAQGDVGTEITSTNKVSTSSINISGDVSVGTNYIGTVIGSIAGSATVPSKATNVTLDKSDIVIGTTKTNKIVGVRAGVVGNVSKNVTLDNWTVSGNSNITINGELQTTDSRLGGFAGYIETDTNQPVSITNIKLSGNSDISVSGKVSKSSQLGGLIGFINEGNNDNAGVTVNGASIAGTTTITVAGNIENGSHLGGFAGEVQGRAKTKSAAVLQNVTLKDANISVGGNVTAGSYFGGFVGYATTACEFSGITYPSSPKIEITGDVTATSYVGGAFGRLIGAANAPSKVPSLSLTKPTITFSGTTPAIYAGGIAGEVSTNCELKDWTVDTPVLTFKDQIKGESCVGSAIGNLAGGATTMAVVNNLTVKKPTLDIKDIQNKSYVGNVFGRINKYASVDKVTLTEATLTYQANSSLKDLYIGTVAGYLTGDATQQVSVSNVTLDESSLTFGEEGKTGEFGNIKAGVIGYTGSNVLLSTWTVNGNLSVKVNGNLKTSTSYFGGFAGYVTSAFNAPTTIKNITIGGTSTVEVTGSTNNATHYLGGIFGYIISDNATDTKVIIDNVKVTGKTKVSVAGVIGNTQLNDKNQTEYKGDVQVGGFAGHIEGRDKLNNAVKVNNIQLADVTVTAEKDVITGSSYFGGLVGYVKTACEFTDMKISTQGELSLNGDVKAGTYVGAAFARLEGTAAHPTTVSEIALKDPKVYVNGNMTNTLYIGGLAGYQTISIVKKSTVDGGEIVLNGNNTGNLYVGGAAGWLNHTTAPFATVQQVEVKNLKIRTEGTHTYAKGNKPLVVGGVVGYVSQTNATTLSEVRNCVADGVDINLGGFVPEAANISGANYNQQQNAFVVGGVIGRINTPQSLPEYLYFSGKIYAPNAMVAPIVGVFYTKIDADRYVYNDYSGLNAPALSVGEWAKESTWYYNGYKLGLSNAVITQSARTKNYTGSLKAENGVNYLDVTDKTFSKSNQINAVDRLSRTVLAYTKTGENVNGSIYPSWNTNAATYPVYYMYYVQGVNRGSYIETSKVEATKAEVLSDVGTTIAMELVDDRADKTVAGNRGVVAHTLTAKPSEPVDSYKWYVNGVLQKTATLDNFKITPSAEGDMVVVEAIKDGKCAKRIYKQVRSVLRVKDPSASLYGTKDNPYLIGSKNELLLFSALTSDPTTCERTYSASHYNKAYYEMDADIDMKSVANFTPISFPRNGGLDENIGGYHSNFVFDGVFDGKYHTIKNLNQTWYGGVFDNNNMNIGWGLFSRIGTGGINKKIGATSDSDKTQAVIRNLVLTTVNINHKADNTSFRYNNGVTSNGNNVMVGPLVGIVANAVIIENVEVRKVVLTDEGKNAREYDLYGKGLYVGGAIGSVQNNFNSISGGGISSTIIKNIVVDADMTLTNAKIHEQDYEQLASFNVGGIVGRYFTNDNLANTQKALPQNVLYSGTINAPLAFISPVVAATRYNNNFTPNKDNMSKIWEGNNNDKEQLKAVDALYYNFYIVDENGVPQLVTDDYPSYECKNGARALYAHTDGSEDVSAYTPQNYQGVNLGALYIDSNTYYDDPDGGKRMALAILNNHTDISRFWKWNKGYKIPQMSDKKSYTSYSYGAYIEADESVKGRYNIVLSNLTQGLDGYNYDWYVNNELVDGREYYIDAPAGLDDIIIKADVRNKKSNNKLASTQFYIIKGEFNLTPSIEKSDDTYTIILSQNGEEVDLNDHPNIGISYQWYKGNVVNVKSAEKLEGETNKAVTITKEELGEVNNLFCHVTIMQNGESGRVYYDNNVSYFVGKANVIYLQLADVVKDSKGVEHTKPSVSGVGTVDDPVTSWEDAYAKLAGYTEPKKEDVVNHGGKWTKDGVYDDEAYYLANKDTYPFDTYKRDGNKRKVKPIDQCENNWNNNIIVLMGLSTDAYFNDNNGTDGGKANKPVTITGMWDGINYYGFISHNATDLSLNADHKFEHIGLGLYHQGSITENKRYRIYAHRWDVWAGRGLLMGWAAAKKWGIEDTADPEAYIIKKADHSTGTPEGHNACDIAIMGGYNNDVTNDNPEMFEWINHGRDTLGQQIRFESGFWGPVSPGNRQTDDCKSYIMGGPDYPAKTVVTVDIYREDNDGNEMFNKFLPVATVDIGCLLTGNHEGTMYGDATVNLYSGKMGRLVNGSKGSQRGTKADLKYNPTSFETAGHYRHIVKYSVDGADKWYEIGNPPTDSYFGRGIINIDPANSQNNTSGSKNDRVSVIELYCGGLGRAHNDGSYHPEACTYFYGLSEINIKGGTFTNTIFGSGAGGVNGIGTAKHHTDDNGLPYWNTDYDSGKTHVWYAPYDYVKGNGHNYDFVKVKVANDNKADTCLTTDGYVDLEKTRNIINITGGVFGSLNHEVSIYAGGNGVSNPAILNPSTETKWGANIKNKGNTPNHQAGNIYGAADGLTSQINISGDAVIYGSIFGGGKGSERYYRYFLRVPATKGADGKEYSYTDENQNYSRIAYARDAETGVALEIGELNAPYTGYEWLKIQNQRLNADNYLSLGQVYGNTKITIGGDVKIYGNIYGAGEGVRDIEVSQLFSAIDREFNLVNDQSEGGTPASIMNAYGTASNGKRTAHFNLTDKFVSFPYMGSVTGTTCLDISGNVIIHGNVYGGGQTVVDGDATLNISDNVQIYGRVFGGGKGLTVDRAQDYTKLATITNTNLNIKGNVTVWQDIYGGGENATITGDANLNLDGGNFAGNIYGGGLGTITTGSNGQPNITTANVGGDTKLSIDGGRIIWDATSMADNTLVNQTVTHVFYKEELDDVTGDLVIDTKRFEEAQFSEKLRDDLIADGYEYSQDIVDNNLAKGEIVYWDRERTNMSGDDIRDREDGKKYAYKLFFDDVNKRFNITHNIFAGGAVASHVAGNATVTVTSGMFGDDLIATKHWQDAYPDAKSAHFAVFGGGNGSNTTVNNTKVTVGSELATAADEDIDPENFYGVAGSTVHGVVGGSYGGIVLGNTDVVIRNTYTHHVYGGGFGDLNLYNQLSDQTVIHDDGSGTKYSREDLGLVKGNTKVRAEGGYVHSDIFGGGCGVESAHLLGSSYVPVTGKNSIDKDFTMGQVLGATDVELIGSARVQHSLYGGGDIASVLGQTVKAGDEAAPQQTTKVTLRSGLIIGDVFGGGNGRLVSQVKNHADGAVEAGSITGNSLVIIESQKDDDNNIVAVPEIRGSVYGGGSYTQVKKSVGGANDGNTYVTVAGGNIGGDIFGGGLGDIRTVNKVQSVTNAHVQGTTNVIIDGGAFIDVEGTEPANHNVYGGGNVASVNGATYVTVRRGMLDTYPGDEIYNTKHSPKYSVFGAGYGENTSVAGDTHVTVDVDFDGATDLTAEVIDNAIAEAEEAGEAVRTPFKAGQTVMDVYGGGYYGAVTGATNVELAGKSYIRNAFGGSFNAFVNQTNVNVSSVAAENVFGGGMIGDVTNVHLTVGAPDAESNDNIYIINNVYGGNDVSGNVTQVSANIFGGNIYNNVYGVGNGDYLYTVNNSLKVVTPHDDFEATDGQKYNLVYEVPWTSGLSKTSAVQTLIATNYCRPTVESVVLNLSGTSKMPLNIAGNVFGGGNSTTVNALTEGNTPSVTFNIGSYCNLGGVYMGSDGDGMIQKTVAFQNINGTDFSNAITWSDGGLSEKFLPVEAKKATRTLVYPKLFDLYFAPVAMSVQPALNWVGSIAADGTVTGDASALAGTTIGTFVCGAKHGNMNVKPDADGKIVDYTFPAGLTIKNRIVGGCNDANLTLGDLTHVGGYLLGTRDDKSDINLTVECQFAPEATAESEGNVYGGCYNSGTVNGDVKIDMRSDMLANLSDAQVQEAKTNEAAVASVFGAGYGMETMVNGQTEVLFGKGIDGKTATALNVFGAGQQGNLVGNSTVKVLNGHVAGNVAGGTYAGRMWGSAQVLVGYPKYYTVKNAGTYNLSRADRWNASVQNFGGTDVIKKQIKLLAGDIISEEVYDAITDASKASKFTAYQMTPTQDSDGADWKDIDIKIDGATYGGGYSLTEAGAVGMYENTVLKYNDEHYATYASRLAYGGNTTVLVWDNVNGTEDHIAISTENDETGGIFGDGHLTFAEGFRAGEIKGYGFAEGTPSDAKFLNTIQRMDMLRVSDCAVQLSGARDYNLSEVSTAPYSLARIGELQMKSAGVTGTALKATTEYRSRNFMGLAYSTHNVGAVTSDVAFAAQFHDSEGAQNTETYRSKKQGYVNSRSNFEERNAGTAKNMISITSGHALKIANAKVINAQGKEEAFYGPIVGVVEIALANSKRDEAGAYVYAANIHHRNNYSDATTVPDAHTGTEDFLETTGNFMLAYNEKDARYLLDDCYNTEYDEQTGKVDGQPNADQAVAHYWYVSGWEYFFSTNITGYTYNTSNTFYAKNDGSINLVNISKDTEVTVESIEWNSEHSADHDDELENRNVNGGEDASGINVLGKYKLYIGTSDDLKYDIATADKPVKGAYYGNATDGKRASMSFTTTPATGSRVMLGKTVGKEDNILIALQDDADNHGQEYYDAHLAEPCKATIVLSAPAKEDDGSIRYKYTVTDLKVGETIPTDRDYYYKDNGNYVKATSGTAAEAYWPYYTREEGRYRYTIYLDINYVMGPEYSGNILIANCALPGELIKVSLDDLKVTTDPMMPAYGFNWKIGPRTKGSDGKWKIDNSDPNKVYTYKIGSPYNPAVEDNATSEMLAGVKYNEAGNYIEVPAYYFMNGYGVEYNFSVASINEDEEPINLTVEMRDQDQLTVHNYHRMSPRNADGITEANVTIEDLHVDLAAQRATTDGNFAAPRIYIADGADLAKFTQFLADGNGYGKNMQFHLLNNVDAESVNAAANFNGTLHGNGYVISGINNYLFTKNEGGNIYNLGMKNGLITKGDNGSANSKYHTSYTWANKTVYRMGGEAVKNYSDDDWRYGNVTYDLNQYYLEARQSKSNGAAISISYVDGLYANGDYLFARIQSQSAEYLRTTSLYDANYNSSATYSRYTRDENGVITHPVDQSRAVYVAEKVDHYVPLFETAYGDASQNELTAVKNDYIFFGQNLNADTKGADLATVNVTMPGNIIAISHEVEKMKNRVYRAVGYYASKDAYQGDMFYHNVDAYVHANGITAIDFRDYKSVGSDFYTPAIDYRMNGIDRADDATRNLLVYAHEAADATAGVLKPYVYDENTREGNIMMHVITPAAKAGAIVPETKYLHLVERTVDNQDAEDNVCLNNDFCAPVAFNVTERAWYSRKPVNYAKNNNDAWEGICLPFTAKKVVATKNGEITHFYGKVAADVEPENNDKTLHHEYWLRGLTGVTSGEKTTANFQRPGSEEGLFITPAMTDAYVYYNSYLSNLPGYNSEDNPWYNEEHSYVGYTPLTANIPYIVSFPGERYYEFDLTGQRITFSRDGETLIPVTSAEMKTTADNYVHNGTFVAADAQFGLGEDGVAFDASVNEALPFRTYMTTASMSAKMSLIFIGNNAELEEDLDKQDNEILFGDDYLKIYPQGRNVVVESGKDCILPCHGISGSLIGNWTIKRGTNVFRNLHTGIYLIGSKKIVVK